MGLKEEMQKHIDAEKERLELLKKTNEQEIKKDILFKSLDNFMKEVK